MIARPPIHHLPDLLARLDPEATLVARHLWLIDFFDWIRGDCVAPEASIARIKLFLDSLDAHPGMVQQAQAWWRALMNTVDATPLLADYGFASRSAFVSELAERLRLKLLPATPETSNAAELFPLVLDRAFDAQWISAIDEPLMQRLQTVLHSGTRVQPDAHPGDGPTLTVWRNILLQAVMFCTSQVRATGFSPELRLRMSVDKLEREPFHNLPQDVDAVRAAYVAHAQAGFDVNAPTESRLQDALQQFRERLEHCRQAAASVYTHLDEHGISVNLVFRLRQLRERVLRIRALLDCLTSANPSASTARLLGQLVAVGQERRSLRALVASNSSLLAAKVAERSSETGEHYITRTPAEYRSMFAKAAGGGVLTSLTTWFKFMLMGVALAPFWDGFWSSVIYALSFIAIGLLHWTLATKQPAMTAPAMAAKLKDLTAPDALRNFVDEVTHLVRSQVAAVLGNVLLVVPAVLLISLALLLLSGQPMIDAKQAATVLQKLSLLGPTLLFAAFTGILLFASSIIAGWVENWFVLHRLKSALRYNPRITAVLGPARAARWALFWRNNISALASNISLGFMLGLIPAFADFFGLGLQVRHVTLSAGQLAAACASLGWGVLQMGAFWWCVASIPLIGALNLTVSFYLAFRLALQAHNVTGVDRVRIRQAIWQRWKSAPLSFFRPARGS